MNMFHLYFGNVCTSFFLLFFYVLYCPLPFKKVFFLSLSFKISINTVTGFADSKTIAKVKKVVCVCTVRSERVTNRQRGEEKKER